MYLIHTYHLQENHMFSTSETKQNAVLMVCGNREAVVLLLNTHGVVIEYVLYFPDHSFCIILSSVIHNLTNKNI